MVSTNLMVVSIALRDKSELEVLASFSENHKVVVAVVTKIGKVAGIPIEGQVAEDEE